MTAAKENAYYPYIKGNIIYFLHKPIYFTILHFIIRLYTDTYLNFTNNMYLKNRRRILLRPITSIALPSLMLKTMGVYSRVKSAKHVKNYGDGLVN